jgi:hypothetical protein
MKRFLICAILLMAMATASAQTSPLIWANGKIGDAKLVIKYGAPSVRGRNVFGQGGPILRDRTYPIWRAGANTATSFHTNKDLTIAGLKVPKGTYSFFVNLKDPAAWELVINKQTGQSGLVYDPSQDLGRVKMQMSKPPAPVEVLKYTITAAGDNKGTIQLEWADVVASVDVASN